MMVHCRGCSLLVASQGRPTHTNRILFTSRTSLKLAGTCVCVGRVRVCVCVCLCMGYVCGEVGRGREGGEGGKGGLASVTLLSP